MKAEELKTGIKQALHTWLDDKVDTLFKRDGGFDPVAYYVKNGIRNAFCRYDAQIDRYIDTLSMFVGDEQGNINADKLMDDLIAMFGRMEQREATAGPLSIRYGAGEIVITLPDHPISQLLLPWRSIKLTTDDLSELKALL